MATKPEFLVNWWLYRSQFWALSSLITLFQGQVVTCRNFILTSQFVLKVPTFFSSSDSLLSEVDVDDDDEERRLKENKQNLLISSLVIHAISSEKFLTT